MRSAVRAARDRYYRGEQEADLAESRADDRRSDKSVGDDSLRHAVLSETSMQTEQQCGAHEAAAKIQAGFRGYRVRKRLQEQRLPQIQQTDKPIVKKNDKCDAEMARIQQEQESCDQIGSDEERSSLEDKSAIKIQAGVRGFLVRKRQQAEAAAATRIQAGFRGFRTRKLLKQTGQ